MSRWLGLTTLVAFAAAFLEECQEGEDCEALEMLQLRARKTEQDLLLNASNEARTPGSVYMIFTFGAVATSTSPLKDLSQPSQRFRGLRCYTEDVLPMGMGKQIDAGANLNQLYHSQVPTLVLHKNGDSEYYPEGRPDLPAHQGGVRIPSVELHDMQHYFARLLTLQVHGQDAHAQSKFASAYSFSYVAWGAYERQKRNVGGDVTMETLIKTRLPNWQLVAQEQQDTLEAVDNLWLLQNKNSKDCLLAFEGTHTFNQFFRNLKTSTMVKEYCGFPGIHEGYVEKLHNLMKVSMPKLKPKLAKCFRVGCTGHSLGGALCEVFAACANSQRFDHQDFQALRWDTGSPELMPAIHQKPLSKDNINLPFT